MAVEKVDNMVVTPDSHTVGKHTDVTREVFLVNPMGDLANATLTASGVTLDDAAASEVWYHLRVPDDFVSFTSVKAAWKCPSPNGAVNMFWSINAFWGAHGEAEDNSTDAPAMGATTHAGEDLITEQLPTNVLTLTGLALGDYLIFLFSRDATNGLDTINAAATLKGLLFTYVGHQ